MPVGEYGGCKFASPIVGCARLFFARALPQWPYFVRGVVL